MIVGTGLPDATRRSWSPSPVRPGICMSVIKQAARFRLSDARNSSADAKASAAKPSDFMSACIASRTDSSSSPIEMSASFNILLPAQAQDRRVALPTSTVWDPARRGATILWGQLTSVFLPPARVLGCEYKPSSPIGRPACSLGQYSAFQRNGNLISIGRLPAPRPNAGLTEPLPPRRGSFYPAHLQSSERYGPPRRSPPSQRMSFFAETALNLGFTGLQASQ